MCTATAHCLLHDCQSRWCIVTVFALRTSLVHKGKACRRSQPIRTHCTEDQRNRRLPEEGGCTHAVCRADRGAHQPLAACWR